MDSRKKQVRFSEESDLKLLREVLAQNPFLCKKKWSPIAEALTDDTFILDGRRVRERTELLVKKYKKEDEASLKESGVEEEYNEKKVLLQEIVELMDEAVGKNQKIRATKEQEEAVAKTIRKRAMEGMQKDEEAAPAKTKKATVLEYLKEKQEKEKKKKRN